MQLFCAGLIKDQPLSIKRALIKYAEETRYCFSVNLSEIVDFHTAFSSTIIRIFSGRDPKDWRKNTEILDYFINNLIPIQRFFF